MTESPSPFQHHGTAGEALGIGFTNGILNILTLFLWRFWGKTRVRQFLWNNTTLWGDPLEYTGRGMELFLGFLIVAIAVFVPVSAMFGSLKVWLTGKPGEALIGIGAYGLGFFLAGAGLYRAQRYQLSRTVWRGIRGGLAGEAWKYGLLVLAVAMASGLTLGWAWPWGEMKLARMRLNNTEFGSQRFSCTAYSSGLYGRFALAWLGAVGYVALMLGLVTAMSISTRLGENSLPNTLLLMAGGVILAALLIALPLAAYKAAYYRRLAAGTSFGRVTLSADTHSLRLIGLLVGNWFITVLTLGFGRPWAALRTFRLMTSTLRIHGEPDFAAIAQNADPVLKRGEGLAAVFDGAGDF